MSKEEEEDTSKPIPDQIFEEMISDVRKHPEFDTELVKKVEKLYANGGLQKATKIIETIIPELES
ncbi:MAG: hypothetical protein JW845_06150 [Dehalococcoidales bacterium]|nr:hypothetical protein [Dehalococcoidales bacterium]